MITNTILRFLTINTVNYSKSCPEIWLYLLRPLYYPVCDCVRGSRQGPCGSMDNMVAGSKQRNVRQERRVNPGP